MQLRGDEMEIKKVIRKSGVLCHISSLPSRYGIGTLGQKAYEFVDFLSETGQKCWQVLPIGPTSYGDSPYQSTSAFAGNPYFIDLDFLVRDGLLDQGYLSSVYSMCDSYKVDYGALYRTRREIFWRVAENFSDDDSPQYKEFCQGSCEWLDDFSLFCALKEENDGRSWAELDKDLKFRKSAAIERARERLANCIRKHKILQFLFMKQWFALKSYAELKNVKIIGDMPIYVAYDSADVWSTPDMFKLNGELYPSEVAGCPPDAFSHDGQLWGNPLYYWESAERRDRIYDWWRRRISQATKLFDVVRIDHFRAFADYYSIPAGSPNARSGEWKNGAGESFFDYLKSELGELPIIAEDLGFLSDKVRDLLSSTGFPGMKIIQFGFDSDSDNEYLPHNYQKNSVVYIGTHDNPTAREWLSSLSDSEYKMASEYMGLSDRGDVWGLIRAALSSVSDTSIVTLQDLLMLGTKGRMNTPSQSVGNWTFRAPEDYIFRIDRSRLKSLTQIYGR